MRAPTTEVDSFCLEAAAQSRCDRCQRRNRRQVISIGPQWLLHLVMIAYDVLKINLIRMLRIGNFLIPDSVYVALFSIIIYFILNFIQQ